MIKSLMKSKSAKLFGILAGLLFLTMLIFENINGRFWLNDFKVMYSAADAFLDNRPIYGESFGLSTGYYKYSPFTLLLFTPYTLFSYKVACFIHFLLSVFIAIVTVLLSEHMVRKYIFDYRKKYHLAHFVIFALILLHLVRDLHLGNINMIIVFLIVLSFKYFMESKFNKFSIILAIVILAKPYFIVLILPLLLHKKFKAIMHLSIAGSSFVLISLAIIGVSKGIKLYIDWFNAMLSHSSYLHSNNTIFYLLKRHFGIEIGNTYSFLLLGIISVVSGFFFWLTIRKEDNQNNKNSSLLIYAFMLMAIIPNIFITDTEHFLFSLPLISVLVIYFSIKQRFIWIPLIAMIMLLYSGNSTDMLGDELNEQYKSFGLLGIGNLALIIVAITVYSKANSSNEVMTK